MTVKITAAQSAERALAGLALPTSAMAMGISPIFMRLAEVGPFASAFWRVALALPVLYLWMRLSERGAIASSRRPFARATILAGLFFIGDLLCWHLAVMNTTVANATFFATTAPVFVVLVGWLALGRKPARATLLGLALCLAGGAALIGHSMRFAPERMLGDAYGIGTAAFFGLYFLAVEAARRAAGAARVTFEASVVTAIGLAIAMLAVESRYVPTGLSGWGALLAMAWISHAGGQGLLAFALGRLPVAFSSLVIFIEALFAAVFAWLFLGEAITLAQALGGALILHGIWIARP